MGYLFILSFLAVIFYFGRPVSVEYWGLQEKKRFCIYKTDLYFWVFWLLLFLLTALRARSVGNDTGAYLDLFNRILYSGTNTNLRYEMGYQYFNFVIGKITQLPQAIIIASAMFTYGMIAYYYRKYCVAPLLALVCFFALFYSGFTNTIRLAMACCILLFSYENAKNKRVLKTIFFLLLAVLFHNSAIIFAPYLIVEMFDIKFRRKLFGIIAIIFLALCISGNYILSAMNNLIPAINDYYSIYMNSERVGSGWLGIIFLIIKLGIMWITYFKIVPQKERDNGTTWLYAFALLLYFMSFVMNLFDRLASIYMFVLIVPTINEIIYSENGKKKKYLYIMISSLIGLFLIEVILKPEWNALYPYSFFWE